MLLAARFREAGERADKNSSTISFTNSLFYHKKYKRGLSCPFSEFAAKVVFM
jgi:hypothetical protein